MITNIVKCVRNDALLGILEWQKISSNSTHQHILEVNETGDQDSIPRTHQMIHTAKKMITCIKTGSWVSKLEDMKIQLTVNLS